jgi:preprotein translocase subunit SecG
MDMNIALVWVHIIVALAFVTIVIVQEDAKQQRIVHKK